MYDPYHPHFQVHLEPVPSIPVTLNLTNHEIYYLISCLENNALDERTNGKIDESRRIAKLIMKIEGQLEK